MSTVKSFIYKLVGNMPEYDVGDTVYYVENVSPAPPPQTVCACGHQHHCKVATPPTPTVHQATIDDIMLRCGKEEYQAISIHSGKPTVEYKLNTGYWAMDNKLFSTRQDAANNTDPTKILI